MELLKENHFAAKGVDSNKEMVEYCLSNGLDVVKDDIISYLKKNSEMFDCIIISQVIEHLNFEQLINLIELCKANLNDNGRIIIETPNPETVLVSSYTFYLDFSHIKPIPPIFLQYILVKNGFNVIETKYLHPFPESEKLLELVSDKHDLNNNFKKLNELLYGPRDYVVIASKEKGE